MAAELSPGFWQHKTLAQMNDKEWEALCDGCGKCCLQKLQDEDTEEVYYTQVVCRYYETQTGHCGCYEQRTQLVPTCIKLSTDNLEELDWLPTTCAYRRLRDGLALPSWHPLLTGSFDSVHEAQHSVAGKVISDEHIHPDDWQDHIIHWVEI